MQTKESTSRLNKLNIIIYLKRNRESYVASCTLRFPISFYLNHSNFFSSLITGGGMIFVIASEAWHPSSLSLCRDKIQIYLALLFTGLPRSLHSLAMTRKKNSSFLFLPSPQRRLGSIVFVHSGYRPSPV